VRKKRRKTLYEEFSKSKKCYYDVFCSYDFPDLLQINFSRRNY
jgi:hypothetical protein